MPALPRRVILDTAAPLAAGLTSLILFDGPVAAWRDYASQGRTFTRQGTITQSLGARGRQVVSTLTGLTGSAHAPRLDISAGDPATSGFSASALVRFDGTAPTAGSVNRVGSTLFSDGAGVTPLGVGIAAGGPLQVLGTSFTQGGTSTGLFTGEFSAEFDTVGATGSPLGVTSLSGWHRLTVVVDTASASSTLYVDGGSTWTGTATVAVTPFTLRSLLGDAVHTGTDWQWPVADFFFWSRPLSAAEAAGHAGDPYETTLRSVTPPLLIVPSGDVSPPVPPVTPPIPVGDPTLAGVGTVRADAHLTGAVTVAGACTIGGTGFVFSHPVARLIAPLSFASGSATHPFVPAFELVFREPILTPAIAAVGSVTADPTTTRPRLATLAGAGAFAATAQVLHPLAGNAFAGAGALAATPALRASVRALVPGAGSAVPDPFVRSPFGQFATDGAGTVTATSIAWLASGAGIAGNGSLTADTVFIATPQAQAKYFGEGRVAAKGHVRKKRKQEPVFGAGAAPQFFTIEVETFIPGVPVVMVTFGHGVRAHGTLSRVTSGAPEKTGLLRASDLGYRTAPTDLGGPIPYPPWLDIAFQLVARMNLDPAASAVGAAWGAASLSNAGRQYDTISHVQNCDGRPVRILLGAKGWEPESQYLTDPPYGDLDEAFIGLAGPWALSETALSIPLHDVSFWLERPLQTSLYGGHGALDGALDIAGKPYPKARGGTTASPISNITPTLVDPLNRIYQYTDGRGSVVVLYENGGAVFGNAGDVANLYVGTTPPGTYRTDNSRGLFQLGSVSVGQITADVTGEFPSGAQTNPFAMALRMLTDDLSIPAGTVDAASFNAAAARFPSLIAGVYFSADDVATGVVAVETMLAGLGASVVPTRDGQLGLLVLEAIQASETVTETLDETVIEQCLPRGLPATMDPPPYRVRVGYSHNYTVQAGPLSPTTPQTRAQFVAAADRFSTWIDTAILAQYRRPNDPAPIPSPLLTQAGALAVANRHGAMWGTFRRVYDVTLPMRRFRRDLGDVIMLRYPLEQLADGKAGRIVGFSFVPTDAAATYTVLV